MQMEIAAMNATGGLFLSWTPIGMTVFKVGIQHFLEYRIKRYLEQFIKSAINPLANIEKGNKCQESLSGSIVNQVKETIEPILPVCRLTSVIEKSAKDHTRSIIMKI